MSKIEKPSVLVVDDDDATATLLRALLQPHFAIEIAADGNEAIEKLRVKQYAATLLDLRMPHRDGFAVLDFFKSARPESLKSVLVVTALLTTQDIARVKAYGVHGIVAKPFEIDSLLAAVKSCVDSEDGPGLARVFCTPAILFLADLLRQKLM